ADQPELGDLAAAAVAAQALLALPGEEELAVGAHGALRDSELDRLAVRGLHLPGLDLDAVAGSEVHLSLLESVAAVVEADAVARVRVEALVAHLQRQVVAAFGMAEPCHPRARA